MITRSGAVPAIYICNTILRKWASRSLQRESDEVIMIEVQIEEMFGSDRTDRKITKRAVVVDAEVKENEQKTLTEVNGEVRSKKI
jgi:hypothetical protein